MPHTLFKQLIKFYKMKIEKITFNTAESKIIVVYDNNFVKEYLIEDQNCYLQDNPSRSIADFVAMGWIVNTKEFE